MLGGDFDGQIQIIPRTKLSSSEGELPYIVTRKQLPIRLCFAMTVNKSQGQSFDEVAIDLCQPAFVHGQFYVGSSRVRTMRGYSVLQNPESDGTTENVIYEELLLEPPPSN